MMIEMRLASVWTCAEVTVADIGGSAV